MRWGLTIQNHSGMAGVIAAMLLILLNAAIWMVMNTADERVNYQKSIKVSLSKKANQLIVDNAATLVIDYCDALVLGSGPSPGPTAPISESTFRSEGINLSQNFKTLYDQMGFKVQASDISLRAYPMDSPERMPASASPILSGLQAKLEVGTGLKKAQRTFMLPVLMRATSPGNYSISACKTDEESSRCYLNSNALYFNMPAPVYVTQPTNHTSGTSFDDPLTFGRISCFSDTLRKPDGSQCNKESNTLAAGLRVCMGVAQIWSHFVTPSNPVWNQSDPAARICLGMANMPRVIQSCPIGGGPVL